MEQNGRKKTTGRTRQTRQQRSVTRTHAKLLDAGRSVFSEKGLDLTTVDDITQRADLGRGTFYYHFASKQDLISEVIKGLLGELAAEVRARCSDKTELPELLDAMIEVHTEFFSRRWEDFVLYYQGRADMTLGQSWGGLETPFNEYLATIEQLVDSSISEPIPGPVLRRVACAIAGFISGYYSFAVVSSVSEDVDSAFASLRSAFVASLVRFIREAVPDAEKKQV